MRISGLSAEALELGRQLLAPDLLGVVTDDPEVRPVGEPAPVRRDRPRRQIGEVGTIKLRHHLLACERLDLGGIRFYRVHAAAAAARFGQRPLHHILAERAPELDLDAVLRLESLGERRGFARRDRGVERERALRARLRDQPLLAVGASIEIDGGIVGAGRLRASARVASGRNHANHDRDVSNRAPHRATLRRETDAGHRLRRLLHGPSL